MRICRNEYILLLFHRVYLKYLMNIYYTNRVRNLIILIKLWKVFNEITLYCKKEVNA